MKETEKTTQNTPDQNQTNINEKKVHGMDQVKYAFDTTIAKLTKKPAFLRAIIFSLTFIVVVLAVWGVGSLIVNGAMASADDQFALTPTIEMLPDHVPTPEFSTAAQTGGLFRLPEVYMPSPPPSQQREDVITYTVEAGDSIFVVADKFGLRPETVLWANRYIIGDTPDGLFLGVQLYILPEDGVYHKWSEGEGLNGVASFYGVHPDEIVNYPLNNLSPEIVGDYANPNIEPGTMLVVPGGERPTVSWIIPRDNPASGSTFLGPGACGGIIYGDVGTGTYTWPTSERWLSGYDYTPPVHNGLDFAGRAGFPIYAADSGVVVYSGWSDRGFGNLIVIDHDRGWQSFYAHLLDGWFVPCGSNVQKGQLIGSMGSTGNSSGPHLHFELRYNGQPVNPWNFLQ